MRTGIIITARPDTDESANSVPDVGDKNTTSLMGVTEHPLPKSLPVPHGEAAQGFFRELARIRSLPGAHMNLSDTGSVGHRRGSDRRHVRYRHTTTLLVRDAVRNPVTVLGQPGHYFGMMLAFSRNRLSGSYFVLIWTSRS